jgi:hypothetical protein
LGLRQVMVTRYQFIIYRRKFVLEPYRGKVGLHSTFIFKEITDMNPEYILVKSRIRIANMYIIYNNEERLTQDE